MLDEVPGVENLASPPMPPQVPGDENLTPPPMPPLQSVSALADPSPTAHISGRVTAMGEKMFQIVDTFVPLETPKRTYEL